MFNGVMTTTTAESVRLDLYAQRMQEVQDRLELSKWFKIREATWQSPAGDRVRFSYAHKEWRIFTAFVGKTPEMHVIPVRPEPARIPTADQILFDIVDIRLAKGAP